MELEHMRRILAERGMGWTIPDTDLGAAVLALWHPDTDWAQCGMVIEAMREKGWCIELNDDMMCYHGRWHHMDGDDSPMVWETTFCKWATLSAYRALEATDA